jgi:hypothetical protein
MNNCPFCEKEHTIIVPLISINGTAPEDLRDQVTGALKALTDAERAMLQACPNGRDYQNGAGAAGLARTQHAYRLDAITRIQRELGEILDHIQAVIDFKAAGRKR